jgi:glycosyltransferase involved in cell wall biosynthesis
MKLAILGTRGIPARYGGFETFAEQLAIHLAGRGVSVTVFCPARFCKPDSIYRGITLKYVKSPGLGSLSETAWDVQCLWRARREYDVVYMLGVGAGFAAWIPRLYGATVWINSDGVEWKRRKWTWLQRAYLAAAEAMSVLFSTRIIADADAIAEYLRKRYPGLRKVSTIAYGADIPALKPRQELLKEWSLKPGSYYLVVCRLEPENHILEIVEGFEKSKSGRQLVILGNIESSSSYVQTLLRHKSERIRFLGTVYDKAELSTLRCYACAYLHGHSVGGTNPSLLEAMACSNLVIAHDNPFNREVLGSCGLYWSTSEEVASIVDAVDELRVDADYRMTMAVEIIRTRYSWERIADAYLSALHDARPASAVAGRGEGQCEVIAPGSRVTGER